MTSTAWSFAVRIFRDEPLFNAISQSAMLRIGSFSAWSLANTAWASSICLFSDWPLCSAIAAESRPRCNEFATPELAGTVWAFSRLAFLHQPLITALAPVSRPKLLSFQPQELANTAWAVARFSIKEARFFRLFPLLRCRGSTNSKQRNLQARRGLLRRWQFSMSRCVLRLRPLLGRRCMISTQWH